MQKEHKCLNCEKLTRNPKYCCLKCGQEYRRNEKIKKWLSGEISGFDENWIYGDVPVFIRNYLMKQCGNKCEECGWNEVNPYTGRIPLCVVHIDGNYKNNRPENFKVLCPTCFSKTRYWKALNKGRGKKRLWTSNINRENDNNTEEN